MKKQNKYIYEYVVQGNYGYGWDDLTFHDKKYPESWRWAKDELLLYSNEEKHASHRIIERRTLRNNQD